MLFIFTLVCYLRYGHRSLWLAPITSAMLFAIKSVYWIPIFWHWRITVMKAELAWRRRSIVVSVRVLCVSCYLCRHFRRVLQEVGRKLRFSPNCAWRRVPMAYNVVVAFLSWQLILPHLTMVHASTHWVVTEDGRIQAQVVLTWGVQEIVPSQWYILLFNLRL